MRFVPFYLIYKVETEDTDELDNVIFQEKKSEQLKGRFTEWSAEDVSLYGREMTRATRKLVVNGISAKLAKKASHVEVDGYKYQVESVKDLYRWTLLIIRGYRL